MLWSWRVCKSLTWQNTCKPLLHTATSLCYLQHTAGPSTFFEWEARQVLPTWCKKSRILRKARDSCLLHTCEATRAGGRLALGQNVAHATTRALVVATRAARGRADVDCAHGIHNYCHCIGGYELRSRVGKMLD